MLIDGREVQDKGRNFPSPISVCVGHTLSTPCGGQSHSDQGSVCLGHSSKPTLQPLSDFPATPSTSPGLSESQAGRPRPPAPGRVPPPPTPPLWPALYSASLYFYHPHYTAGLFIFISLLVGSSRDFVTQETGREAALCSSPGVAKSSSDSAQWAVFSGCRMTARAIGCSSSSSSQSVWFNRGSLHWSFPAYPEREKCIYIL